ncbi:hypothetical protein B0H15DRAFT_947548 [Mycena belliarum]|uniref:Uncharacterized protein n=1 Tax=Mycena belliarum TaxID=1033014 RepID=A0AAD6U8I2_9AGAR|nr:hypothetical protein B0H15DRAFT_947548 [Mycena belliae]
MRFGSLLCIGLFGLLSLLLEMATLPPTPSSSHLQRRTTAARGTRHVAMVPEYRAARAHRALQDCCNTSTAPANSPANLPSKIHPLNEDDRCLATKMVRPQQDLRDHETAPQHVSGPWAILHLPSTRLTIHIPPLICLLEARDPEDPDVPWTINPTHPVTVYTNCAVETSDQSDATFTAPPEQYMSAAADAKYSHHYRKAKKPISYVGRYVGFMGYLTGLLSALEGDKIIERFRIEVDVISFLGTISAATVPKVTPSQSSQVKVSSSKTPRWSYTNRSSSSNLKRGREDDDGPSSSPSIRA